MSIQHSRTWELAFSLNRQSDIRTGVANALINKERSVRTFAPIKEVKQRISDRQWYGKGHSFPTFSDQITRYYELGTVERSATLVETLYAVAMVMGGLQSSQSGAEWTHAVSWQSLATNKEVVYTSLIEKVGAEYQKKLTGAYIESVTITGDRADHVKLSMTGAGRQYVDNAAAMPGITTSPFLKTLYGLVSFGAAGAPADISVEVLSFNLTISQNPQRFFLMGNSAGEEMLLSKVLIGDQTVSGQVTIFINATHRNRFLNQDDCELRIICKSPTMIAVSPHMMTIQLPHFVISEEAFSEEGQTIAYQMNFNEESVLKPGVAEQCVVTFVTDIPATELLVVG